MTLFTVKSRVLSTGSFAGFCWANAGGVSPRYLRNLAEFEVRAALLKLDEVRPFNILPSILPAAWANSLQYSPFRPGTIGRACRAARLELAISLHPSDGRGRFYLT